MDIDRILYWFMTREPLIKLSMSAALVITLLLVCMFGLSILIALIS
jgi:hypothetical protein